MTDENYITFEHDEATLSWAWASNYNVQNYTVFGDLINEFSGPETQEGWRLATDDEISYFKRDLTASNFFDQTSGIAITAISFFNTNPAKGVSVSDFNINDISFDYIENSTMDGIFSYYAEGAFDTFFVSDSLAGTSGPRPIPEPLTIILFATALITLQIRQNKKSA